MRELQVVDAIELAIAYAAAEYVVQSGQQEYRLQVGRSAAAMESGFPASRYAFLTAWNPASDPRPDDANHAADARLVERLDALVIERRPAWAQSPDGRWREPGWLLCDADTDLVVTLAREFGQAGVLDWACGEPVHLRMLAPRPGRPAPSVLAASIHWVETPATA